MDLSGKVLRSELSFSRERTCRRPEALITKSLKLKFFSRSSLPKVFSNTATQNTVEGARKTNLQWSAKTETPLVVCMKVNKNDTPPQTLPRKHQDCKDDLFKERLWGAATHVSAF